MEMLHSPRQTVRTDFQTISPFILLMLEDSTGRSRAPVEITTWGKPGLRVGQIPL